MNKQIIILILSIVMMGCGVDKKGVNNADTVYINGKIYTVNEDSPWIEAVAIGKGNSLKLALIQKWNPWLVKKPR